MKILYVITKATGGGAQQYVYDLALAAKREGHEPVLAYGVKGQLTERLIEADIRTIQIAGLTRDVGLVSELRTAWNLLRALKQERPDIVHLNSSKAGGLGAFAARLARVERIIFTAHGWPHKEPRSLLTHLGIRLASWLTIILTHYVVVVSGDDMKRAPVIFSRHKLQLVKNGIEDYSRLAREEARSILSEKTGQGALPPIWLMNVAELHTNKGLDVLIEAFAKLASRELQVCLILAGAGEEKEKLMALTKRLMIATRVVFTDFLPDARSYLAAADLFVFPSRKEGMPFALLEAGLASLPVIASRVGGIPEVIEDGAGGLLVPPDDPGALAEAIQSLIKNPERAARLGTALRAHVEKEFSKERMVQETFALYGA